MFLENLAVSLKENPPPFTTCRWTPSVPLRRLLSSTCSKFLIWVPLPRKKKPTVLKKAEILSEILVGDLEAQNLTPLFFVPVRISLRIRHRPRSPFAQSEIHPRRRGAPQPFSRIFLNLDTQRTQTVWSAKRPSQSRRTSSWSSVFIFNCCGASNFGDRGADCFSACCEESLCIKHTLHSKAPQANTRTRGGISFAIALSPPPCPSQSPPGLLYSPLHLLHDMPLFAAERQTCNCLISCSEISSQKTEEEKTESSTIDRRFDFVQLRGGGKHSTVEDP